ncbi:MAG: hypothetical protein ACXWO7_11080, partial [Candidatus Limnocylindrales bacterium]
DEVERQLAGAFLRHRFRNEAAPAPVAAALPPPDTIPGAFMRDLEERIAQAESSGQADQAAELREALRLGRILLDDPSRVTLV